jgi:hypothetical protein
MLVTALRAARAKDERLIDDRLHAGVFQHFPKLSRHSSCGSC